MDIDEFLSLPNFQQAWFKVAENQGCAGVDGERIEDFAENEELNLIQLLDSVANSTYSPQFLQQVLIPKNEGKWRELRIPTVRDRIVQQALLNVLYPVKLALSDSRSVKSQKRIMSVFTGFRRNQSLGF